MIADPSRLTSVTTNLLALFLVSVIALPEVLASVALDDELRRLAGRSLGAGYWILVGSLALNIALVVSSSQLRCANLRDADWAGAVIMSGVCMALGRLCVFLFFLNTGIFTIYFARMIKRISSAEEVLQGYGRRVRKRIRQKKLRGIQGSIDSLVQVGRDASPGYEKTLVLDALEHIAAEVLAIPWSRESDSILSGIVSGFEETVHEGGIPGDCNNARQAMRKLISLAEKVVEEWGENDFRVAKIVRSFSKIAAYTVGKGCSSVVLKEAQALADMCRKQILLDEDSRISPEDLAYRLETIGHACVKADDFAGALNVLTLLMDLLQRVDVTRRRMTRAAMLFSGISVLASMWESKAYPRSAVQTFVARLREERELVPIALEYGKALDPVRHLRSLRFARSRQLA